MCNLLRYYTESSHPDKVRVRVRVGARWKKSGSGKKLFPDPLFLPLSLPDLFQHNSSAQAARVYHHINGPASVRSGYYLKCVGSCRQIFKYRHKRQVFRNPTVIYRAAATVTRCFSVYSDRKPYQRSCAGEGASLYSRTEINL